MEIINKGESTMNILELILIAVGLSMDAFAVSICMGLTMRKVTIKKSVPLDSFH